jgi:hypothetical protein
MAAEPAAVGDGVNAAGAVLRAHLEAATTAVAEVLQPITMSPRVVMPQADRHTQI